MIINTCLDVIGLTILVVQVRRKWEPLYHEVASRDPGGVGTVSQARPYTLNLTPYTLLPTT